MVLVDAEYKQKAKSSLCCSSISASCLCFGAGRQPLGWAGNGEVRLADPLFLCQGVSRQLQIAPLMTQDIS